jgi:NADH-quinone oxidoreductase subunit L
MIAPLVVLALLSVFGGALNLPGVHTFTSWLEHTIEIIHEGEFNVVVAGLSTVLALAAILVSWLIYGKHYQSLQSLPYARRPDDPLRPALRPLFALLENKYYVDELYKVIILDNYVRLAKFLAQVIDWRFWHDWFHDVILAGGYNLLSRVLSVQIDLGIIDGIANGLATVTQKLAASMRRLQTGYVRNYAFSVFMGVVVIMGYLIVKVFIS